jgi:hypothetical protein
MPIRGAALERLRLIGRRCKLNNMENEQIRVAGRPLLGHRSGVHWRAETLDEV